jgi:hypothetical protein
VQTWNQLIVIAFPGLDPGIDRAIQ